MRSLAGFDWAHPASINRQQVEMLMRLDFLKDGANVVFIGPCGVGKSFLASCLVENACRKGIPTLFAQAVDIVNDLLAAQTAGRLPQAMRKYSAPALLCIDELGYLPLGKDGCNLLSRCSASDTSRNQPSSPPTRHSKTGEKSSMTTRPRLPQSSTASSTTARSSKSKGQAKE